MVYEALIVAAILILASLPFAGAAIAPLEGAGRHLFQAYLFLVVGLYFTWCWRRGGQTLPMKAWKLRLIRRDGRLLDTPRALLRYLLAALALGSSSVALMLLWQRPGAIGAWLALAPGALTILWSFFDRERQFLHDRLAGTRIVLSEGGGGKKKEG